MAEYNAPRRGAVSFYPRVRARKETPSIKGYGNEEKALNFLCYKVGMTQVVGKNAHKDSPTFGQHVVVPATVVECPPLKVFGIRAYEKDDIGVCVLGDVIAESTDSHLRRKIFNFRQPATSDGKETKADKKENDGEVYTLAALEKDLPEIQYLTLLVHTQPAKMGFKKTPDVSEVYIGGAKEKQLAYAKEKLGKDLTIDDVFKAGDFLDVRAVTKGHGFEGVIKRFNVRIQRAKSKRNRVVGSIGPWHPNTVMFTVARPGQMGYQNRTEVNKKILSISDKVNDVNPKGGFKNYGMVKEKYALIVGSLPGPAKRCIALRKTIRPIQKRGVQIAAVERVLN